MTDQAPERIWAWGQPHLTRWSTHDGGKDTTEYVRADLLEDAVKALAGALEWIDAVPSDKPLPAMPGFDRNEVDATLAKLGSKT